LHFEKGVSWYRKHFPSVFHRRYTKARYGAALLTGEASAYYIFHPSSAARVAETMPRIKLIALLRNPIDRAYSHYYLQVRKGREPLSFEDAIAGEQERLQGEQEKMLATGDYQSFNYRRYSYLRRGLYAEQLTRWMKLFPAEDLLVVRTEDLESDPAKILEHTLRFLNVPEWEPRRFAKHNGASYPAMKHETRRRLVEYFEPHNRRLGDLIGREFHWDR
jgi:Sulfotransferase domain